MASRWREVCDLLGQLVPSFGAGAVRNHSETHRHTNKLILKSFGTGYNGIVIMADTMFGRG